MKHKYIRAWQLARWLNNALAKAPTKAAEESSWRTYERTCWLLGISYGLAYQVRRQLKARNVSNSFMCRGCYKDDTPMPIKAVQIVRGQRIGRSCNYWRCECGTINKYIWVSGYPTRYDLLKGFIRA